MSVSVVGVSHRTAPLEVRERFVIGDDAAGAALRHLTHGGLAEAVLLSTCNRTELYLHSGDHSASRAGVRLLAEQSGMAEGEAGMYLYTFHAERAVEHLFRVVSSLDSMILGEAQIQGQVKQAYARTVDFNGGSLRVGPVLSRMFETALRVGGRVRAETRLGAGAASVPSAAVELARRRLGSLHGRAAVVLGAGEMSQLAVRCLTDAGVTSMVVASRSEERASATAQDAGAAGIGYDRLPQVLADVDLVVCATAAPHAVLTRSMVERARATRGDRTLLILDLAMPRDVEPGVATLPGVQLVDLDDLARVVAGTLASRRSEVALAEQIVAEGVTEFWSWYRARTVVPAIRAMRGRAEHVRREQLDRLRRSLPHLSDTDLETIDRLNRQMLARLLHGPTTRLREAAAGGHDQEVLRVTRYLFSLGSTEDDSA